jgi:hypothetical protein
MRAARFAVACLPLALWNGLFISRQVAGAVMLPEPLPPLKRTEVVPGFFLLS